MSDMVTETLIEMHFLQPLVSYFKRRYGARFLKLIKPCPQNERWVGFDQGWVSTSLRPGHFFDELKCAIAKKETKVDNFYLGFFLQFKKVEIVTRRSANIPAGYGTPYYRSELSLTPNKTTKLSQHETLLRLQNIGNASVFYACAMMFDINDIYEEPSLDKLRFVPVSTAPSGWATNTKHHITFQYPDDPNPKWCSEPVEGVALSFEQWATSEEVNHIRKMKASELLDLIYTCIETVHSDNDRNMGNYSLFDSDRILKYLSESFIIIEFENQ